MSRDLLKRAVTLIKCLNGASWEHEIPQVVIQDIETYLAQPEPEPVAWALFSKELMPTGAAYAIRRVEIQLAQIESDLDIQDAKIRPLYTEQPNQSARIADLTERLAKATLDYAESSNLLTERITELEKQLAALQAKREPLSDDEIRDCAESENLPYFENKEEFDAFARAIEAAHNIGVNHE